MVNVNQDALVKMIGEMQLVAPDKLDELIDLSEKKNVPLEDVLVSENAISDMDLGRMLADILQLPFVRISEQAIDENVLKIIPEVVAKSKKIISFKHDQEGLHVATSNPADIELTKQFLEKKTGEQVKVYFATSQDIEGALGEYSQDAAEAFSQIINENVKNGAGGKVPEPSIIKLVDTLISYAYSNKASDIHIEPYESKSLIRFRIDGILHDIFELPSNLHDQIITRVKVLAQLRTDEHFSAQDGKIESKQGDENLDIRVSIVPVSDGEKVVMRLLSERSRQLSLDNLGIAGEDLRKIQEAYGKPHGMILVTGPTGCGKTTTLYTILKIINKRDINIMTIEDPVEYDIEGVNQIQVNEKKGLGFADGLRSVVRQDPDVILVGEIRDEETADISVNAAMTGHLVLSTLHTNDAATTIPRLLDLNVEPYLVASTVNVIVAQRLVRKICTKCRYSKELSEADKQTIKSRVPEELVEKHFNQSDVRVYQGKGCELCHNTGYLGRVGIFEVMVVDDHIREAIVSKKDASQIGDMAKHLGMTSMMIDGIRKVLDGVTTIEEILRVTKE